MVMKNVRDAYQKTEAQSRIHPVKLIHLLYSRVLTHLELAEEAILKNEPRKRGENLGKAIAIVAELHASVDPEDTSEAAAFLRGLYEAILGELPKVGASKDVEVLRRAHGYLARLKEIWEQEAMRDLDTEENGVNSRAESGTTRKGGYGSGEREEASRSRISFSA
jgi:flagellar protein FliS